MSKKYIRGFSLPVSQNEELLLNLIEENGKYSLEFDGVAQMNGGKSQYLVEGVENKDAIEQYGIYWTRMYSRGTEGKNYEEWLKNKK